MACQKRKWVATILRSHSEQRRRPPTVSLLTAIFLMVGASVLPVKVFAGDPVTLPVKENRIRQPDFRKYHPIHGVTSGESFFLHYCLPDFVPRGEGNCKAGIPGSIPDTVQVKYQYSLGKDFKRPLLEGGGWFVFPFPINVDVEGKTPYAENYRKRDLSVGGSIEKPHLEVEKAAVDNEVFEGLVLYKLVSMPDSFRWWIPEDRDQYQTALGNPPIFSCSPQYCNLTLDLGNGWEARAIFNEVALSDWENFFVRFKVSTKEVMEKYYGI